MGRPILIAANPVSKRREARQVHEGDEVMVNFGSGADATAGWVNVDKSPALLLARRPWLRRILVDRGAISAAQGTGFSAAVVYGNAAKPLRFSSQSVACLYSSHMIEHVSRDQGLRFLTEARRVLRPGGVIRLATPDLAALVETYLGLSQSFESESGDWLMSRLHFMHDSDEGRIKRFISRNLSGHWHQWLYDAGSLVALLAEAGFERIEVVEYRQGRCPDLERIETRPDSLFVEAAAPLTA